MDTPIGHEELRIAIRDIAAAQTPCSADPNAQWDQAISVLVTAREQHGGDVRRLITVLLAAASKSQREQLAADIDTRLRTISRTKHSHASRLSRGSVQLTLFDPGDAATLVR
jgi:hypothetical protein